MASRFDSGIVGGVSKPALSFEDNSSPSSDVLLVSLLLNGARHI